MTISFNTALGLQESALTLRVERANILSSNLANADTPNYKARDIDFQQALAVRMDGDATRARSTHSGHLGRGIGGRSENEFLYRVPSQPSIDGNTVEEDAEHAEFMKNNMEFQIAFTFLNSKIKGLQKAIRGE